MSTVAVSSSGLIGTPHVGHDVGPEVEERVIPPRPASGKWPHMVYGYLVDDEWAIEETRGQIEGVPISEDDEVIAGVDSAIRRSGLGGRAHPKVVVVNGKLTWCIALAESHNGSAPLLPPRKYILKLNEVLGKDRDEEGWYKYDGGK